MDGSTSRSSRAVGSVGGIAGIAASLFVLFGPVVTVTSERSDGLVTTGTRSGIDWVLGAPDVGFALLAWPIVLGVVSLVGAVAAWRGRRRWTFGSGLALLGFTVVGGFSIGLLYAPGAVLLTVAAVLAEDDNASGAQAV